MEFMELPYGFRQKYSNYGILVQPNEAEIFKQYILHHQIDHRYNNLDAVIRRVSKLPVAVIFWRDWSGLHYFRCDSIEPRWTSRTPFRTLYTETIDVPDFMDLL